MFLDHNRGFNPQLEIYDKVADAQCPLCNLQNDQHTNPFTDAPSPAILLNNGEIVCPRGCGFIRLDRQVDKADMLNSKGLMRRLAQSTRQARQLFPSIEGVHDCLTLLYSSRSIWMSRPAEGLLLRLEFECTYASDCDIADTIKSANQSWGYYHNLEHLKRGVRIPPALASVCQRLFEAGYAVAGKDHYGNHLTFFKGDSHWDSNTSCRSRGIWLRLNWC